MWTPVWSLSVVRSILVPRRGGVNKALCSAGKDAGSRDEELSVYPVVVEDRKDE